LLAGASAFAEEIKIGAILPLTGGMAVVGEACRDAIRMAIDDAGKTKNHYSVIFEDDRLVPANVATAAKKLVSINKVNAIVSTWSYGGRIVSPLAEQARIPHIGVAWDKHVADGAYNFLALTPPSEFMRKVLEAFQKLKVKRVALLGVDESGSVFALDEFTRMAPEFGVEVVFRDSVAWDLNDFAPIITRISQRKPEYLLYNLGGDNLNLGILKTLQRLPHAFKITAVTSFDVLADTSFIEGSWYVSDSYLPDDFAERFSKKYGHTIRYGVGNFYEAARLLIHAFENSEHATAEEAKALLAKIHNFPSIFGSTSVDESGIFTYPARYLRIDHGSRVLTDLDLIAGAK
jgi:branched-chain amino acid transport system substrate-binding protein